MMRLLYSLAFKFGLSSWKLNETPPEIIETADRLKKGSVLDLGCGEGEHVLTLAKRGWRATGIDFVPKVVQRARVAARKSCLSEKALFIVGDVTRLGSLSLPVFDFAFDIGCFHLLNGPDRKKYINGLASVLVKKAPFLLFAFTPRARGGRMLGFSPGALEDAFSPLFTLEKFKSVSCWRFPANLYWFIRKT
jgi:SAM-dependent methyltransferase